MSFAELAAVAAIGAGKRPLPRLDLGLPEHDPADPAADAASLLDAAAALAADPRISEFMVESENFESIHNHSAYAYIASAGFQAA